MKPLAVIIEERELKRLLKHLNLPTECDQTKAARSPPLLDRDRGVESQIDPAALALSEVEGDAFEGRDEPFDEAQDRQPADWM